MKTSETLSPNAWKRLQKLRQSYLDAKGFLSDYWADSELLEAYDETLAQRIRWKWRSVWEALPKPQRPLPKVLVDFGCGSGAASREVLSLSGGAFERVVLLDRSKRAVDFAAKKIRAEHPGVTLDFSMPTQSEPYFLLVSHVFSELPEKSLDEILPLLKKAERIIWVESGRHQESRRLSALRSRMSETHLMLAPCPHQGVCGMLAEGQAENWCHFRALVPREVHQSAYWREVSKQLGFDLRSLPVAYLYMASRYAEEEETYETDAVQLLAGSRAFKGFVRYHGCHRSEVFAAEYMKRRSKKIHEDLSEPSLKTRYAWNDLRKEEANEPI